MNSIMNSFNSFEDLSAKKIFDEFRNGINKKLGQNFLFDEKINHKIVAAAGNLDGKTVIEIGPGPGGLTLEILKQNVRKLYLLELDTRWVWVWKDLERLFNGKLEVVECDALKFDMKTVSPNVIISNLPYNISTQLIFKWLPEFDLYEQLVLTFQKEVADRLYAIPCTKAYGKLSVLVQWKSQVSKMFELASGSFFPAPKVKSTVLKFVPFRQNELEFQEKYSLFLDLLANVFRHRRKIAIRPLSAFLENPRQILMELGYGENVRAEQISVADYIEILRRSVDLR